MRPHSRVGSFGFGLPALSDETVRGNVSSEAPCELVSPSTGTRRTRRCRWRERPGRDGGGRTQQQLALLRTMRDRTEAIQCASCDGQAGKEGQRYELKANDRDKSGRERGQEDSAKQSGEDYEKAFCLRMVFVDGRFRLLPAWARSCANCCCFGNMRCGGIYGLQNVRHDFHPYCRQVVSFVRRNDSGMPGNDTYRAGRDHDMRR
jgi:hypothetical protein